MFFRKSTTLTCVLTVALVFVACSKDPASTGSIYDGFVYARKAPSSDAQGWLHVKEGADDECGIVWTINSATKLRKRTITGGTATATFADFTIYSLVHVTSAGFIAESCPGQATATVVELR